MGGISVHTDACRPLGVASVLAAGEIRTCGRVEAGVDTPAMACGEGLGFEME